MERQVREGIVNYQRFVPTIAAIAVSLPLFSLTWHVWFHIAGAVLFMGNLLVACVWITTARADGRASAASFAARTMVRTDMLVMLPGFVLLLLNGLAAAAEGYGGWGGFHEAAWIELALALFVVAGVVWGHMLIRYQRAMVAQTADEAADAPLTSGFSRAYRRWLVWAAVAMALLIFSLYLMVAKPALWG